MAIQNGKNMEAGPFCFEQNRWRRRVVLPWRTTSSAMDSIRKSTTSEFEKVRQTSEDQANIISNLRAQALIPLSPAELHALYAGTSVPQHRYLAPALVAAVHSPEIAMDPAKWFAGIEGIPLSGLVDAWLHTNNDSSFEQLRSVSLDPHTNQWTAVLTIKQSRGYSGGPATAGSREYVAFWVDWGHGFQYEGTASVAVFDSNSVPASGLEISVSLPVDFSRNAHAECLAPPAIKVRAVLSWNTPPSTTHPYAQVVWGNSMDLRIIIASNPAIYSRKMADIPVGSRRGNSSFFFKTGDAADGGLSLTQYRCALVS